MKKISAVIFCLALAASLSFAEGAKDKVYIGAGLSMSFENFSYDDFIDNFTTATDNAKSLSGARYDFSLGYRLGQKYRIEAQYIIVSQNNFKTDHTNSNVEYKATGVFANLIYDFWDMQDHFLTPFIGAGAGVASPNLNISYNGIKNEADKNGFSWQFQGGLNVKLTDWLLVNAKYTYISMPDIELNVSSNDQIKAELKKGVQAAGVGIIILL